MAGAIREITLRRGHDASRFTLACFGGAGGQHACLVADALGMTRIFIHPLAGVLSAYGMGLADQSVIRTQAVERELTTALLPEIDALRARLEDAARAELAGQGAAAEAVAVTVTAELRLAGTDAPLPVALATLDAMRGDFGRQHQARFGFSAPDRPLILEALSVEAVAAAAPPVEPALPPRDPSVPLQPIDRVPVFSGGETHDTPVYERGDLRADDTIAGPALIREANATTMIEPHWSARMTATNGMVLDRAEGAVRADDATQAEHADPILLELFRNLFMSVAEQAGVVLQNASLSVNIKERLDFSCAIFDAEGRLIANAPHVPVHLGAMGESVRHVIARRGETLRPGDVVALNNPFAGGTHLPDITVITPIFDETGQHIRFFTANRGHHADIGGTTPGSTPPDSCSLEEEGVVIDDFLLVQQGEFREQPFRDLLGGARFPARSPDINVADIAAQIAANEAASREMGRMLRDWGWPRVRAYMDHLRAHAAESVRRVIDGLEDGAFALTMDDGAPLRVAVTVDHANRRATIDFAGTGAQSPGNFNAPPGRDARRRALRVPLPHRRGHPAQRRLPGAVGHSDPVGQFPGARAGRRRGGRQYGGVASRLQYAVWCIGRLRLSPSDDE